MILVALIGFAINANADDVKTCSVKQNGTTIGYVTAWVESDTGILYVSNDTDKRVTVTVTHTSSGVNQTVAVTVKSGETTIGKTGLYGRSVVKVENPICN